MKRLVFACSYPLITFCAFLLTGFPVAGQDLDSRFKQMGEVALEANDANYDLVIPWDTKRERGYALVKDRAGRPYYTVTGSTVTPGGRPGSTQFSVSFMLIGENPIVSNAVFRLGGSEPRLFELVSDRGNVLFDEIEVIDETAIRARLSGELTEVDANGGVSPSPIEDASPLTIKATIDVSLLQP